MNYFNGQKTEERGALLVAELEEKINRYARVPYYVLITGQRGTGKTTIARKLHEASPRASKEFINLNCASLTQELLESELFGYEKGAFTGAMQSKAGKFEAASGGTLFLDEIGELDKETQAKLLKAVEEKRITRVGSIVPRDVDVRVIYATHRDPLAFREDLRYRVAAHIIKLKPLRERPEEIMPLARLFINDFIRKSGRSVAASEEALQLLKRAKWCGNVRELRSFIQKACLDALFLADLGEFEAQGVAGVDLRCVQSVQQ